MRKKLIFCSVLATLLFGSGLQSARQIGEEMALEQCAEYRYGFYQCVAGSVTPNPSEVVSRGGGKVIWLAVKATV